MTPSVAHLYRQFRGNMERTAEAALASAKRHVHFLRRLSAEIREGNNRSRAAKRGWKTRRQGKT